MELAPCLCHVSARSELEVDRGVVILDTGKFVIIPRVLQAILQMLQS